VAELLDYKNRRDALNRHVDKEDNDGVVFPYAIGREQKLTIINETSLYSLVLSSKLETAKRFKHCAMQTYWTQKGRLFIYGLMIEDGNLPLMESREARAYEKAKSCAPFYFAECEQ